MPEGHIIHRLAREQTADLGGLDLHAASGQDRFAAGAARLDGQVLQRADAWGKHLFHRFASGDILHTHLGLIGRWTRRPPDEPITDTTRLRLEGHDVVWDLTGPMRCELVTPDELTATVAKLGPDPLRRGSRPDLAWERIHRSDKPVGLLLLDQHVIAGIGNVYRSEILNIVGVDPRRAGRDLDRAEMDAIWAETVRQLRLGARRGRIVTVDPSDLAVPLAKLPHGEGRFVYKRDTCGRCGTVLDVYELGKRTTWSCPSCQPR